MQYEQFRKESLQKRALKELYQSEILEWYRNQYNIPLEEFYKQNVDEDIAFIDFYRRQYWNEIRYGVRTWGDNSNELKMPSFSLFRPFGGALPVANGFGLDNSYTVKNEHYQPKEKPLEEDMDYEPSPEKVEDGYTYIKAKNLPQELKGADTLRSVENWSSVSESYGTDNFKEMVEMSQNTDNFWELLESITLENSGSSKEEGDE